MSACSPEVEADERAPVSSAEYEFLREVAASSRERAGLSQAELARRIGRAPLEVVQIETGQRHLTLQEFFGLLSALEVSPELAGEAIFVELMRLYPGAMRRE